MKYFLSAIAEIEYISPWGSELPASSLLEITRHGGEAVTQESAKLRRAGSIPARASLYIKNRTPPSRGSKRMERY